MMVGGEVHAVRSRRRDEARPAAARRAQSQPHAGRSARREARRHHARACGGEIVAIAGVAGNGQDELFDALSGERARPSDADVIRIDGSRCGPARRSPRAAGSAPPSCRRSGSATRRAALHALRECRCSPAMPASPLVRRGFIDRGQALRHRERVTKAYRRAQGQARPRSRQPVGRQPAEIRRRPRDRAQAAVLVVSQPTWGVDAGAAAAIRQALIDLARARLGGAGDQPGPRRDLRDFRPHRGDLRRAAVGAAPDAARRPRRDRPADGGRRHEGEGAMRLVLERRAERSIAMALLSPLLAIALTLATGALMFALLGKPPLAGALRLFHRAADRSLVAPGDRRQGDAAGADRRRACRSATWPTPGTSAPRASS